MQSAERISAQSEQLPRRATQGFFQLPNSIAENLWLLTPAEKDVVIIIHRRGTDCTISDSNWEKWTGKKGRIKDNAIQGLRDKGLRVTGQGSAAKYSFDRTGWEGWISSHHVREKARTAGRQKSVAVPAKPDMQVHPECRARGCGRLCEDEPKVISISSAVSSQVEQPVAREEIPPEQPVAQPPPRKGWGLTLEAVQMYFPHAEAEFVSKLRAACAGKVKVFTDSQLAGVVYKAYKTSQKSEGLFLSTVPARLAALVGASRAVENKDKQKEIDLARDILAGGLDPYTEKPWDEKGRRWATEILKHAG